MKCFGAWQVQSDHFEEFFAPELEKHGYAAVYKKKTAEVRRFSDSVPFSTVIYPAQGLNKLRFILYHNRVLVQLYICHAKNGKHNHAVNSLKVPRRFWKFTKSNTKYKYQQQMSNLLYPCFGPEWAWHFQMGSTGFYRYFLCNRWLCDFFSAWSVFSGQEVWGTGLKQFLLIRVVSEIFLLSFCIILSKFQPIWNMVLFRFLAFELWGVISSQVSKIAGT